MKGKALLFPGQGAQKPFMGKTFYDTFLESKEIFQQAEDLLSLNITSKIFSSDEEVLKQTDFCQVALFVTSNAILKAIEKQMPDLCVKACAGLSLGEYSALVGSNKVLFSDLLRVVSKRGELMHKASLKVPQGMCAVIGLDLGEIKGKYQIANLNCPGQVVIAGSLEEMKRARQELKKLGARRVIPLKVSGAFHSSYMDEAKSGLLPFILNCPMKDSEIDLIMNVTGKKEDDLSLIKNNLIEQVTSTTHWMNSVFLLDQMDLDFIEVGPKQLSSLNKKMDTVNTFITIEEVKDLEHLYETV